MKNQNQPLVSIIMASYNYALFIEKAIESVLNQTYNNWELLIVDDGSSDDSIETIKKYTEKHNNISLFQHPNNENQGLNETLKLGLKNSNGEYIAFLESDDYWEKTYLEKKIEIFNQSPETKLVFNDIETFGDHNAIELLNNHLERCREISRKIQTPTDISKYIPSVNLIPTFSCWMVEKKALEECDFNPPIKPYLDFWLWPQIAYQHKAAYINEKLTFFRLHSNSYIRRTKDKVAMQDSKSFSKKLLALLNQKNPEKYQEFITKALIYKLADSKNEILENTKSNFLNAIKDKNIYLYGAGLFAKKIIESTDFSHTNILGIIDGDINKKGQFIGGYEIFHRGEIKNLNADVILICLKEPYLLYYDLMGELLSQNLQINVIPDFFEANQEQKTENFDIENFLVDLA